MRAGILAAVLITLAAACRAPQPRVDAFEARRAQLLAAERDHRPWPLFSDDPGGLPVAGAWRLQQALVAERLRHSSLAGFKTGLVTPTAQQRFGLSEPLFGVLTAEGAYPDGATVVAATFRRLRVEVELALVVGETVTSPPQSDEEAAALIDAIAIAFELPDLGYQPGELRGVDILATNAGAAGWVLGASVDAGGLAVPPEELNLVLTRNGVEYGLGNVGERVGRLWAVARWLITRAMERGFAVEPGAVLLTGAVIGPLPAAEGQWVAEAEGIGQVHIDIDMGRPGSAP